MPITSVRGSFHLCIWKRNSVNSLGFEHMPIKRTMLIIVRDVDTKAIRNLGVVMDTSLSWQNHIKRSSSRIISALIQLARIKHIILGSDLRHAIQTLALNHLHYCTLVWSTAGTSATAPIRRSLRMAERLACSQLKNLGLMCRDMKVLRSRITQKRSR